MSQSKQVSAPSSRSILNYRLTCGFFASVLPSDCTEKGQAGGFGGAFADVWAEYNDPGRTFSEVVLPKTCVDLICRAYPAAESDLTLMVAAGKFMQSLKVIFALVVLAATYAQRATAQTRLGALAAEGEPNRKQSWLVPAPDPDVAAHALLFRPPGSGPFSLAVIAHASTQNVLRRAPMPQPEYAALSA